MTFSETIGVIYVLGCFAALIYTISRDFPDDDFDLDPW